MLLSLIVEQMNRARFNKVRYKSTKNVPKKLLLIAKSITSERLYQRFETTKGKKRSLG